ncbi:MAG: enoyl-CoA hydratase/isomerase family protein [Bacteroidales bacterium]
MTIQWTVEQDIGHLRLNQPPANTMTMKFFGELKALMERIAKTENLRAIVVSGNGRHYSSGADIKELLLHAEEHSMIENYQTFLMLERLKIPVISAIRGVCLGSALELALACHFRICSEEAVFGLPESTFNLMPGIGGIQRFASIAGKANAIEYTLRGSTFSATAAFEMGLVDAVVPKAEILPFSLKFAALLPVNFQQSERALYLHKFLTPMHASG